MNLFARHPDIDCIGIPLYSLSLNLLTDYKMVWHEYLRQKKFNS